MHIVPETAEGTLKPAEGSQEVTPLATTEKLEPASVEGFVTVKGKTAGELVGVLNLMRDGGRKTVIVQQIVPMMSPLSGMELHAIVCSEKNKAWS